jgi:hypothetical protein
VEAKVSIDPETLSPEKNHYLFLYGTGYAVLGDSGKFVYSKLPKGSYENFLISLPTKNQSGSTGDSLYVYRMSTSIEVGKDNPISVGKISDTVPLPDSLKIK